MSYPERLLRHLCYSDKLAFFLRGCAVAVPKTRTDPNDERTIGFSNAEGWLRNNVRSNRLDLVIKATPEDGWYIAKPNGYLKSYLQLSKARLTALITTTAIGGFVVAPVPVTYTALLSCAIGTALFSASANTVNHLLETPYDAQMRRTQSRLLVVHRFSPLHAATFAAVAAVGGGATLWLGCNMLTAGLGFLNALLYAGLYTPMKRYSIVCTWIGAVVGAIPPLMGYAASSGVIEPASLVMAGILYSWQFPHFNALSWNMRSDYARAGYRVMCALNEKLCRRNTLRQAIAVTILCTFGAPLTQLAAWSFAAESLPFNAILCFLSYKFYNEPDSKTARTLFHYTLLYLPLIMMLLVISKYDTLRINA